MTDRAARDQLLGSQPSQKPAVQVQGDGFTQIGWVASYQDIPLDLQNMRLPPQKSGRCPRSIMSCNYPCQPWCSSQMPSSVLLPCDCAGHPQDITEDVGAAIREIIESRVAGLDIFRPDRA